MYIIVYIIVSTCNLYTYTIIQRNKIKYFCILQGGETYIYNYDSLGRVTDVILPTGEKLKLLSDLSDDEGLSVKVSAPLQALSKGDKQRIVEFKMKNERSKILTITDGK